MEAYTEGHFESSVAGMAGPVLERESSVAGMTEPVLERESSVAGMTEPVLERLRAHFVTHVGV